MSTDSILSPEELADRLDPVGITISPDGRHVAFEVAPVGQKEEHYTGAIWISTDAESARQFTSGLTGDTAIAFAPDSTRIAFLSDRHERKKQRLYVLPLNGGEAMRVGTVEGDLGKPAWSPDGTKIGILVTDPETDEDKKKTEDRNDPIVDDQDLKYTRLFVIDVASGKTLQLTYGNLNILAFAWNLDGARIAVITSKRIDAEGEYQNNTLDVVAATGGRLQRIADLRSAPGQIFAVDLGNGTDTWAIKHNGFTFDQPDSIWTVDAASGAMRELLTDDHGNVDAISAIGSGTAIATRLVDGTHANAFIVDPESGERRFFLPDSWQNKGSVNFGPAISADQQTMAMVWSDPQHPEDVYVAKAGQEPVRVTEFGKSLEGRLTPAETVEWESDGWTIQGVLFYPKDYQEGTRYPLLIEAHGGPSWQWEERAFVNWHDWASFMTDRGYAVLAPNPRGSTARGADFQHALYGDVGGGEVRDLINGAQAMIDRGIADPDRLGIGGWSWGGYLTATTITKTNMFKAAMMGAGLANLASDHGTDDIPSANLLYFPGEPYHHNDLYWEGSALKNIASCTTPTLIIHGDADDRVAPSQGKEMYTALTRLGVDAEFVRYPRMGHNIRERNYQIDLLQRLERWFDKYLKG